MKIDIEYSRINADKLRKFCNDLFVKIGLPEKDADIVTDTLVEADLRGVHSHGVMRIPIYIKRLESNVNKKRPKLKIFRDNKATCLLDGGNGMGQVTSFHAMNIAIEKAKNFGISGIGVYNSNHNGSEAYFAMMALPFDMIGYCLSVGGVNHMAPYGGSDKVLGNNPFAIAVPTGKEFPIVLDMACSVVARGWISMAMQEGREIPEGWALDKNGNPTTNSMEAYEGSILPIAGYKGFNLSLLIGIISAVLTGGAIGKEVTNLYENFKHKQNIGHFLGAIDIRCFSNVKEFKFRIDNLVDFVKSSKTIKGIDRIYLPGEKEYEEKKINLKKGIPIAGSVVKDLKNLAEKYNIIFY